ncbi:DUF1906 domain-containing protein [Streptacidiphilus cavernicola]|uniref:DUF1906 domain-containing protein n=1 Tax=Streptacidiphilus cavernicola TaxID=3342716 RepID=A0ABV6VW52_9ACTN
MAASLAVVSSLLGAVGAQAASPSTQVVGYHGYHLRVPAGWPVVDLARTPGACVRFDVHAVYLGHPGSQADCPSHLVGRTDALLLQPLDAVSEASSGQDTQVAPQGTATYRPEGVAPVGGEIHLAVPAAGVLVTASFGASSAGVEQVLRSGGLSSDAVAVPAPRPGAGAVRAAAVPQAVPQDVPVQPGGYTGSGFEACAAPSTAQMSAWAASPYRGVGVYIGGNSRACDQPNLTAGWVSTVTAGGWHIMPIYVGSQAPCNSFGHLVSTDPATASAQGAAEADDAVTQAQSLGIPGGSALYDDMEGYDSSNSSCRIGVLNYLSGWTQELHARGYLSGVYSSAGSGISDLAGQYTTGAYTLPDHIWFAWWNNVADTDAGSYVPAADWADHQRIHQYHGGADETWGGVTINVDGDYLDVDGGGSTPPPPPAKYWVDTAPSAPVYASATSTAQTGTLYAGTNYVYCKVWGRMVGDSSVYNHWWLRTDPDVGPAGQYVSAYYLTLWGNDQADDNNGNVIPDC